MQAKINNYTNKQTFRIELNDFPIDIQEYLYWIYIEKFQ